MPSVTTQILSTGISQLVTPQQSTPQREANPASPQAQVAQASQVAAERATTSLSLEGKNRSIRSPKKHVDGSFDSTRRPDEGQEESDRSEGEPIKSKKRSLAVA